MFVNKLIIEFVFITVQQNLEQKKLYVWKKHRRQKFDKIESKYEGNCLLPSQIARAGLNTIKLRGIVDKVCRPTRHLKELRRCIFASLQSLRARWT